MAERWLSVPVRERLAPPALPLPAGRLAGRRRRHRQRVHRALQLGGEQIVDGAMALDPAHAGESGADEADAEMRLALAVEGLVMARFHGVMAGMKMALVDHLQPLGPEGIGEFRLYC